MRTIVMLCQTNTNGQQNRKYDGGAHGPSNLMFGAAKVLPGKSNSYDHTHVNRMKAQLDNVGAEYDRMVVITNADFRKIHPDIDVIPLPGGDEYLGWWSKMYMYNPNLRFGGTVLYIDLDMMPGGRFNDLWTESPHIDAVLRRTPHNDNLKYETFTPGVNRPGAQWEYLAHIYNSSLVRFNPDKLAPLWLWYQKNVREGADLGNKGDELFVAKWLIDQGDQVTHTEFDHRLMPSYPILVMRHEAGMPIYDPVHQAGVVRNLKINTQMNNTNTESIIPWHKLTAVTMGGPWKPWNVAVKDRHIAERYYGPE